MEQIKDGKFVELAYKVYSVDESGEELMHEFPTTAPDSFVFGLEQGMLEAFQKQLLGLAAGDKFDFTLEPKDAFGDVNPEYIMELEKEIFKNSDGEFDAETVKVGNVVPMMTEQGYRVQGIVTEVNDKKVIMDFNHPLAGDSVRYAGEVISVRQATDDELNPSCGCGGCNGCSSSEDGSCGGCNGNCK